MKVKRETQFTIVFISKNVNVSSGEPVFLDIIYFKNILRDIQIQMLIFRVFVTSIVYISKEVRITRCKH